MLALAVTLSVSPCSFAYGATVGFSWASMISIIFSSICPSPIPEILMMSEINTLPVLFSRYGIIYFSIKGITSLGGPGSMTRTFSSNSIIQAGAVPFSFGIILAPSGK